MRARLAAWDGIVRADVAPPERLVRPARAAKTVLRPGGSDSAIASSEQRLGVRLPPSYRRFLGLSDGSYADPFGAVTETLTQLDSFPRGGLFGFLPVGQLTRLTPDVLPDGALEGWTRDADGRCLERDGGVVGDTRPLLDESAIVVTTFREWRGAVLVPLNRHDEWQLWCLSRDEITGYHSFDSWLDHAVRTPGVDHVMDLIRWLRAADPRGEDLRKVRDPAALPILLAAVEEFPDSSLLVGYSISALGRIKSEVAIPTIEPWVQSEVRNYAVQALLNINTPAAIDALARQDAHHELLMLGDQRAGEAAIRALQGDDLSAAGTLASLGDAKYIPVLRDALQRADGVNRRVRLAAALFKCGAPEGREILEDIVADPAHRERDREAAARVLGLPPDPGESAG